MLALAIEKKREQMIKTAKRHGMASKQVLICSQELDRMIDLYYSQNLNKDKRPISQLALPKTNPTREKDLLEKAQ